MASSSASPAPPLLAQRYRLERRIAQGGMAEVWLATDVLLTRQVAVKVLKPALAADPVVAERFRREAVAVAGLSHPNIVAIYDTVDEAGRQAVVMQFVPGRSLRQILDDEGTLSPEFVMRIGSAVAAALDVAHAAGLVHRDVKPGNILVTPEGRVLLTDFGIAKASSGDSDLTSDNVMMGTAKYLSPEQVRGRRLDGRADLYSLGLVLYECLSGRVPFLGENDAATALARLQRDPTPLGRLRPTLPAGLSELIHRLLARNPDERPASGAVVRSQLERIRTTGDDPTSPTPVPGAPRVATGGAPRPPVASPARSGSTPRSGGVSRPAARVAGEPTPSSTRMTPANPSARPRTSEPRDPTPSAGLLITGRPARQFQQRRTPSLVVVGGLMAAALVLLVVLTNTLGKGNDDDATASGAGVDVPVAETAASTTIEGAPAEVLSVSSYDPNGDDGLENEDQIPSVLDGADGTSWPTACYLDRFLGGKVGVGIVIELSTLSRGTLDVTFGALPWAADVYTADTVPGTLDAWGGAVDKSFSTETTRATFDLGPTPHRYVLVLLRELAPDEGCSGEFPFRGRIAELGFTPA